VILWQNGDPATAVTVQGEYAGLKDGVGDHLECRVKVFEELGANGVHWRIDVTPKDDSGVAEVQYPMLFLPKLPNDYLVIGRRIGQRLPSSYVGCKGPMLPGWAYRTEIQGIPDLHKTRSVSSGPAILPANSPSR